MERQLRQIVPKEKIVIIENYSVLHEDALEERMKRACNNTVLFLGELGKRKGCYDIPDVIKQVKKNVPNVKFVLAGAGSEMDEKAIKQLIKEKDVTENSTFPGWIRGDIKDKRLREADVFFLPSYNEGMPMSVLDAMGYGLPVVSTNVGGIPKIVHDGENGYCCEPGDIIQFSNKISQLLTNNNDRNVAAKESMHIIESGYSFEIHRKRLEELYNRIEHK